MTPLVSRRWQRAKISIADEVHSRLRRAEEDSAEREAETLRQLGDVFSELRRIAETLGELHRKLDGLQAKVDALTAAFEGRAAELRDMVAVQMDADGQSQELLGRLVASTRSRLEVVEEAVREQA